MVITPVNCDTFADFKYSHEVTSAPMSSNRVECANQALDGIVYYKVVVKVPADDLDHALKAVRKASDKYAISMDLVSATLQEDPDMTEVYVLRFSTMQEGVPHILTALFTKVSFILVGVSPVSAEPLTLSPRPYFPGIFPTAPLPCSPPYHPGTSPVSPFPVSPFYTTCSCGIDYHW